ncbi:hypothetical protein ACFPPD_24295 [Cohnella suwonensis]|uniref:DUF2178 domain-containing protein n=1 Tax=Cohnella suwonensis TaxID=696072 RepID=A0ABW0M4F2_9BACL
MSYQEKKNVVSLFSSILIFGSYCLYVFLRYDDANLEGTELYRFWGAVILILIPVSVVARIVIEIIFMIVNGIATKEKAPNFSDELDKLIELKAIRVTFFVFILGFLIAMGTLVMREPVSTMFIILFLAGFVSEVAGILWRLYLYRKGV